MNTESSMFYECGKEVVIERAKRVLNFGSTVWHLSVCLFVGYENKDGQKENTGHMEEEYFSINWEGNCWRRSSGLNTWKQ